MKKLNIRAGLRTRNFRVGGYSVFASLMVAALAVMVNVLVNALPAGVTQLDTTATATGILGSWRMRSHWLWMWRTRKPW